MPPGCPSLLFYHKYRRLQCLFHFLRTNAEEHTTVTPRTFALRAKTNARNILRSPLTLRLRREALGVLRSKCRPTRRQDKGKLCASRTAANTMHALQTRAWASSRTGCHKTEKAPADRQVPFVCGEANEGLNRTNL